jgi:phage minor structural protein
MLVVTSLQGQTEVLTDYKDLTRKRRVNGERSLSFLLLRTERNAHAFDLVQEESVVEYDGHEYRIKQLKERAIGNTPVKQVRADHVFFDIIDVYQYGTINGTKTISEALSFALNGTGYIFVVVDAFDPVPLENFGDDNALALFQKVLELYQAEFDLVGNEVRIYKQIGANTDFQFRYKHNVKTIAKTIKTDNLSTYIKGYGKRNDDGTYAATAEYTSPMADIYGIRHAKPIYDERFTNSNSLLEYIKTQIQDTPEISITIEFVDLSKAGYPYPSPRLGDTVYLIYEPLNIDITTRILEITDYPESNKTPEVTLANFKESFSDVSMRYTKSQIEKIYNEQTGRIRYTVLDEAVKQATEALQSAQTELKFENGIIAIDKNDPNNIVLFNSAGIGISDDGGQTFKTAMTGSGIVADVITAGTLRGITVVSDDGAGNTVTIESGALFSRVNNRDMVKIQDYELYFYDSGVSDPTPDYGTVATLSSSWNSATPEKRGFAIVTYKNFFSVDKFINENTAESRFLIDFDNSTTTIYTNEVYLPNKTFVGAGNVYHYAVGMVTDQDIADMRGGQLSANAMIYLDFWRFNVDPEAYYNTGTYTFTGAKRIYAVFAQPCGANSAFYNARAYGITKDGFTLYVTKNEHDGTANPTYIDVQIMIIYEPEG